MKKFIVSFIFTTVLFILWYYLITIYDTNNVILPRVISNKYYILFLYISIVAWFWIYREDNSKSKLLVFFIFLLNFLYLCSIFLIWNIWLTKTQCLIFIWLLFIGFLATLLKNWIGYIIIILSVIWNLLLLYISVIPLYENWPDIEWFNDQFETKFVIYSNVGINKEKASIQKDNKDLEILNGTNEYNLNIKEWWTEIIFKSDNAYKNSYWFILFKWWEFVEITPQSALKINKDYEIEVLWWDIKYYPENPKEFKIISNSSNSKKSNEKKQIKTWDSQENSWDNQINSWDIQTWENETIEETTNDDINIQLEDNEEILNIIEEIYNKKLKYYIKQQIWWNVQLDANILKLSQETLQLLIKIDPKYEKNIENLQKYLEIFDINLDEINYKSIVNTSAINKNILNWLKDISNILE